jgi:hypothetical protein
MILLTRLPARGLSTRPKRLRMPTATVGSPRRISGRCSVTRNIRIQRLRTTRTLTAVAALVRHQRVLRLRRYGASVVSFPKPDNVVRQRIYPGVTLRKLLPSSKYDMSIFMMCGLASDVLVGLKSAVGKKFVFGSFLAELQLGKTELHPGKIS